MLRYFLSGAPGFAGDLLPQLASTIEYRLLSMHNAFKGNTKIWTAISHHPKSAMKEIMLDSGAFTAFTKGHKVTLEELTATYDDTISKIDRSRVKQIWLINLDVIPGTFGKVATPSQMAQALDESDKNFKILKKRYGDRVLPVFHQTEPTSRLQEVIAQNWFIAMSFRQDFAEEHRVRAAEAAVEYANAHDAKIHGLATTGYRMMARVPFDTVDSATWLYVAAMGGILYMNDAGSLNSIDISDRSPSKRLDRAHYLTVPELEQRWIRKRIDAAGSTLKLVETTSYHRVLVCAHELREWMYSYQRPAVVAEKGLFPI